jgi:DNA-binding LytR/AlgR family response regulator
MKLVDYSSQLGKKLFVVDNTDVMFQVALEDISHIVCKDNETIIVGNDWQKIFTAKSILEFITELKKFGFAQINDNTIINKQNIYRYSKDSVNNTIMMKNMEIFKVANSHFDITT